MEGGYSGRWSASGGGYGGYGGDSMQDWGWGDEDAISDLIAIRRVDSRDVVYENKKKTTKVCMLNLWRIYFSHLYIDRFWGDMLWETFWERVVMLKLRKP